MGIEQRPSRRVLLPQLDVEQVIYATVTLVSVLVVYDVTDTVQVLGGAIALVVGPIVALYAAHVFASGLARHVEVQRVLRRDEWAHEAAQSLSLLVVAVPPLAILLGGRLLGIELGITLRAVVWCGVLSLGMWASVAARRAGLSRPRVALAAVLGLAVGLAVLSIQLLLKPH